MKTFKFIYFVILYDSLNKSFNANLQEIIVIIVNQADGIAMLFDFLVKKKYVLYKLKIETNKIDI